MTVEWSNGPVEGHVNRLKVAKRAMPVQGAGDAPGARRRVEPPAEPVLLVGRQRGGPAGTWPLGKRPDAPGVLVLDPRLDRARAAVQRRGDLLGRLALLGEDDGLVPLPGAAPFLLTGQGLECLDVMAGFDVHDGHPP
jgi:hypothetical protein